MSNLICLKGEERGGGAEKRKLTMSLHWKKKLNEIYLVNRNVRLIISTIEIRD